MSNQFKKLLKAEMGVQPQIPPDLEAHNRMARERTGSVGLKKGRRPPAVTLSSPRLPQRDCDPCDCGAVCQDRGRVGGCRYTAAFACSPVSMRIWGNMKCMACTPRGVV